MNLFSSLTLIILIYVITFEPPSQEIEVVCAEGVSFDECQVPNENKEEIDNWDDKYTFGLQGDNQSTIDVTETFNTIIQEYCQP